VKALLTLSRALMRIECRYHMGIKQVVAVSTLTRANEIRDYRIYADFAAYLLKITKPLYIDETTLYWTWTIRFMLFDSTTIDLCLSTFVWAKFRKTKAAVENAYIA